jgi:hypothetical protein
LFVYFSGFDFLTSPSEHEAVNSKRRIVVMECAGDDIEEKIFLCNQNGAL